MPTLAELGQKVKAKYSDYAHLDDTEVGQRVKAKYPNAYSQFTDIANPVTEGKVPSALQGGPVSYGRQVLENIPGSAMNLAEGAVKGSPAGTAISMILGNRPNSMEAIKNIAKPFIHPIDSFRDDPVGTAVSLYPAGRFAASNARLGMAGVSGATKTAVGQVRPILSNFNLIHPTRMLPDVYDAVMNIAKGGAESFSQAKSLRDFKAAQHSVAMEDFTGQPSPARPEEVINSLYPKEAKSRPNPQWKDFPKSEPQSLDLSSKKPELETIRTKETTSRQDPKWKSLPKVENKEEFTIKTEAPKPREFREVKRETEVPKKTTKLEVDIPEDLHTDYHDMAKVEGPRQARNSQIKDQTIAEKIFEAEDIKDVHDFLARPSEFRKQFIKESTNKKHISDSYGSETRRKQLINRFNSLGK